MKQPSYHCAGGILSVKWHTEPGFVSDWHDDTDHKLVCRASVATRSWRPCIDHFPWERSLGCQVERVPHTATWSESSGPYSFAYGIKPLCVLAPRVWACLAFFSFRLSIDPICHSTSLKARQDRARQRQAEKVEPCGKLRT
jgi:hypothetical protein